METAKRAKVNLEFRLVKAAVKSASIKCVAALLALGAAVAKGASADGIAEGERFRFVHWNIGHFARGLAPQTAIEAADSSERAAAYRAQIERLHPDFLGFSEFEPVFDKAGRLATNEVFSIFPTRLVGPKNNYQCNALFTRFPCVRHEVVNYEVRRQRTYFIDSVFMFGTNEVHVVQTHLDWYRGEDGKTPYARGQMLQLIERFKDMPYVIVAADFNVWNVADYAPFAEAGYTVANGGSDGHLNTFGNNPREVERVLDNIVVKGFEVRGIFVADYDRKLSDHRIFGCNLVMKNATVK